MDDKYITVSQLNRYVKSLLDEDQDLKKVYLRGEISNFKQYSSGHCYFTLKDKKSSINAVMFKSYANFLKFKVEDGMQVLIRGTVSLYPERGKYQIYVKRMQVDGKGDLLVAYEQLKRKLSSEGLFDEDNKKPIPRFPRRIGVITSPTGAAIKDIITTIKRRWPYTEIILFPSLVQGELAGRNIVKQIRKSQKYNLDTLIIGRGGGSIEDLWPFNEEIVARAISYCNIPTVSAVGHERDYTIADFVSDLRAPTPTAAGELVVPDKESIKSKIDYLHSRAFKNIENKINNHQKELENIKSKGLFTNPEEIYELKELDLDNLKSRLEYSANNLIKYKEQDINSIKNSYLLKNPYSMVNKKYDEYSNISYKLKVESESIINKKENRLNRLKNAYPIKNPNYILDKNFNKYIELFEKLELLNPLNTLKRGYTLVKHDGKYIKSSKNLKSGDTIEVEFNDGNINTKVI